MAARPADEERKRVEAVVYAFFEAGKNKDFPALAGLHAPGVFSKFDENPPFTRQGSQDAFVHEQAAFANISDYSYTLEDLRTDVLGDVAVVTFHLSYSGIFVNDYTFEGSPVGSRDRVTMVLVKAGGGWKIAHEHFSRFPDWSRGGSPEREERSGPGRI